MDILPQMTARRDSTSAVRRRPASQHSKRVALLRTASAHCTAAVGHRWMHHGLRTGGRSGRRGDGVARPVHRRSVVGADVDSVDFSLRMSHRRTGPVAAGVERPSTTNRPGGNVRLSAEGRPRPSSEVQQRGGPDRQGGAIRSPESDGLDSAKGRSLEPSCCVRLLELVSEAVLTAEV